MPPRLPSSGILQVFNSAGLESKFPCLHVPISLLQLTKFQLMIADWFSCGIRAMIQLTYSSLARSVFSGAELASMLNEFRKENARQGITGVLFYSRDRFLQLLEGEQSAVPALFQKICRDQRHHDARVLDVQFPRRMFANWSMAFHDLTLPSEQYIKVDPCLDLHAIDEHTVVELCSFVSEQLHTLQTEPPFIGA